MVGLGLWRDRDFRLFWFGETISTAGSAMAVVAMPLTAVLVLHSSTLVVGLLQATAWLPAVLIGLPAGAWVDRRRKRPGVLTIGQLAAVVIVFLVRTVKVGPGLAGILVATMGVGGVCGAMLATQIGLRLGTARGMLLAAALTSPFMLLVPATSRGAGLALFAVGTIVYATGVCATNIIASTFSQAYVPSRLLGRYSSAVNLVIRGTQPLGAVTGAVVGEAFGVRAAMWVAAGAITLSAGILFIGPLRGERDLPAADPSELAAQPAA